MTIGYASLLLAGAARGKIPLELTNYCTNTDVVEFGYCFYTSSLCISSLPLPERRLRLMSSAERGVISKDQRWITGRVAQQVDASPRGGAKTTWLVVDLPCR